MFTPAQHAAIAIVHTVPSFLSSETMPVMCEGKLIGHITSDYVDELLATARNHPAKPVLEIGERTSGGVHTGVIPAIAVVVDNGEDKMEVTMDGRSITVEMSIPGEFMSIFDSYGQEVRFDLSMADAIIIAMQTLKQRAHS
ncbi:hypothetical protein [Sphingomonas sp. 3-13AW]|uniref:hypothetical protein n=1 Tax=Sphingomonas sp. 3-13AW TaxID=3050450 RepID=UPI003BB71839